MVIWKFPINAFDTFVSVPRGTKILSVGYQDSTYGKGLVLWGLVPATGELLISLGIRTVTTGQEFYIPDGWSFLDSVITPHGEVVHIFIEGPHANSGL